MGCFPQPAGREKRLHHPGMKRAASSIYSMFPPKEVMILDPSKAHQLVAPFIPETIGKGLEALAHGERLDRLKKRLGFMRPLQSVIGNPRAEVVDVMKTYIS